MKKILTYFLVLSFVIFAAINGRAQTTHPFELGLNAGAAWLKSDVKMKKPGLGFGATFGQTYCMNATSPLLWGWRFRYLNATTYGQGFEKSYGIANNPVLNGAAGPELNYNSTPGYVYQNYKTHLDEVSLELVLGLNKLRERTDFYPYIFGGAGITKAVTKTNQLDANNQRYNYALIDSTGTAGKSEVLNRLNDLYDGSYESLAEGSRPAKWKFMPSLGLGLSYEVVKGFSIGLEHKVTWALNDVLDGQKWSNTNSSTVNNDMYHYSSVWIKFSFGRATHSGHTTATTTPTPDTYTNTPPVVTELVQPPVVKITSPDHSPFESANPLVPVSGTVREISFKSQMEVRINGVVTNDFNYNSATHEFSLVADISRGDAAIVVSASNSAGTDSRSLTVMFRSAPPQYTPKWPFISMVSPPVNPFTTSSNAVTIDAKITNVPNRSGISVKVNGAPTNAFTFHAPSQQFTLPVYLITGANVVEIIARNTDGVDTETITVIYAPPAVIERRPVVTITAPASSPFTTTVNSVMVNATITNVFNPSQIGVRVNGTPTSAFTFNAPLQQLMLSTNLITGANVVEISASNSGGADSKTTTIIYAPPAIVRPPVITINSPASSPFNTTVNSATVNASITNVISASQISVTVNGTAITAFIFNSSLHTLSLNTALITGANVIMISAGNSGGTDSKSVTIIYAPPVIIPAPVVTITNPASSPFNTSINSAMVKAGIVNIDNASQIAVTVNGTATSAFSYNSATHVLTLTTALITGANVITITATTSAGSDSKTATIIYNAPVPVVSPPVVSFINPATTPVSSTAATYAVNAKVTNVAAASQITITLNNVPVTTFGFVPATKRVSFTASLVDGVNKIKITGTNAAGTDSKTSVITYTSPTTHDTAHVVNPETPSSQSRKPARAHTGTTHASVGTVTPDVVILIPSTPTATTTDAVYTVSAKVVDLGAGTVSVTVRGTDFTGYTFDAATGVITIPVTLVDGANPVIITATNNAGAFAKKVVINK